MNDLTREKMRLKWKMLGDGVACELGLHLECWQDVQIVTILRERLAFAK